MNRAVIARFVALVPTALGVAVLAFFIMRLIPGDAIDAMSANADRYLDPDAAERLRQTFGLDRPIVEQFWVWFTGLLRGDLGVSIVAGRPVTEVILGRFPATAELAIGSLALAVVVAVPAGVLSATRGGGFMDLGIRFVSLLGLSVPHFWLALMMIQLFAVKLGLLPAGAYGMATQDLASNVRNVILPSVTLALGLMAITMRLTRSSLIDVLGREYVTSARAKGLSERTVVYRHALRNALIPVVTVVGLQFGQLLGGVIIIEQVFGWPGLGSLLIQAINLRDYPMVQGITIFLALFVILANFLVDIAYLYLDPRLRPAPGSRR